MKYLQKYSLFLENNGQNIKTNLTERERQIKLGNLLHNFGSIPIQKTKASEVIQKILFDINGQTFNLDEVLTTGSIIAPYNKLHDKLRFADYFDSLLSEKEIRGHNFEGLIAGLFGGELSTSKTSRYDVKIGDRLISIKFLNDKSETPVLGSIKSFAQTKYKQIFDELDITSAYELFARNEDLIKLKYKEFLDNWSEEQQKKGKSGSNPGEGTRKMLMNLTEEFILNLRKEVYKDSFSDVNGYLIAYPNEENNMFTSITVHYLTSDEMCNFVCNGNVVRPKSSEGIWSPRLSSTFKGNPKKKTDMVGSKFEISVPYITDEELIELENKPGTDWATLVFGDYVGKRLRTDVISIMKTNVDSIIDNLKKYS